MAVAVALLSLCLAGPAMASRHASPAEESEIAGVVTRAVQVPGQTVSVKHVRVSTVGPWASARVALIFNGTPDTADVVLRKRNGGWTLTAHSPGTDGVQCGIDMPRRDQRNLGFSPRACNNFPGSAKHPRLNNGNGSFAVRPRSIITSSANGGELVVHWSRWARKVASGRGRAHPDGGSYPTRVRASHVVNGAYTHLTVSTKYGHRWSHERLILANDTLGGLLWARSEWVSDPDSGFSPWSG